MPEANCSAPHALSFDDLVRFVDQARDALPDDPIPCFAHLRLVRDGRVRDLLLGPRTVTEGPITILQWQTAPLASVFFANGEGDAYELTIDGRAVEGEVVSKSLLTLDRGRLVAIERSDGVYTRRADGGWDAAPPRPSMLSPRAPDAPRLPPPWTIEALDEYQKRAVRLPPSRPMLVLGEAGCGKTTVALHRLAMLHREATERNRPFRGLVLVPVEGLRRLSESLLERFGAKHVEVRVFDRWAAVQARRAFPGIPRRESEMTPPAAIRLKRHPAVREALREVARRARGAIPKSRVASANRDDLLHAFGDTVLLEKVVHASNGAIPPHAVQHVIEHTRRQFRETTEQAYAHVTDSERMQTVDALRIDAGTADEDAGSIDAEDYPLLFALAAMRETRESRAPRPDEYDCIVVDEAQEFAPLELELIGRALRRGGTLVVAGDEGQQVDPTSYFAGWDDAMKELGASQYETVRLAVSYRCPPAVTQFARHVLRPELPLPDADAALVTFAEATACHLTARLVDSLRALRLRDRQATVCVICRTEEGAARMAAQLARGDDVHLVRDGDFRFVPGVEVAAVGDVKGLEFDHVVVPDANAIVYPDAPDARRALYVAVTRASVQLAVGSVGERSAIV
jgi:hypothetical protein